MQKELNKLYTDNWGILKNKQNAFIGVCNPLLIKVPDDYENADVRVIIYGQETAGWHGELFNDDHSMDSLLNDYEAYLTEDKEYFHNQDYNKGDGHLAYYHSKFRIKKKNKRVFWNRSNFKFFKEELSKFSTSNNQSVSILWNNLSKLGLSKGAGKATKKIEELEHTCFNIMKDEFDILKPNIVIFTTGYKRDKLIENKLGAEIHEYLNYPKKQLAKVTFQDKDILGIRTYHPRYPKGRKSRNLEIVKYIRENIYKKRASIF
jgi:hypothetical protein